MGGRFGPECPAGLLRNLQLVGNYTFYNKDGSINEGVSINSLMKSFDIMYEQNKVELFSGKLSELLDDGLLEVEISGRNGIEYGLFTGWHENGQKKLEGTFKDNKLDGLTTN